MAILKPHIAALSAYKPPLDGRDPKRHMLLDFNERTLPLSETIQQALIDYIRDGRMQMYPAYGNVEADIARYAGVEADQLMITNGSDQGIDLIIRSACEAGSEAIIPAPSFAMYRQCAQIENLTLVEPFYDFDSGFPTDKVIHAINKHTSVICIANPNNPSGTVVSRADIERILQAAKDIAVLVDECYFEYVGESVCDLIALYPNLFITRTFSKTWGMPSLRLGYVMSNANNIRALSCVRGPYDINQLAIVAIRAALAQPELMQSYVDEVMQQSKPKFEAYLVSRQVRFWPSGANYLWVFPKNVDQVHEALVQSNILVRPKADADGVMGLRMTLGTLAQTDRLIEVLDSALCS